MQVFFFFNFQMEFVRKSAAVKNATNSQYGEFSAMVGFNPVALGLVESQLLKK